MSLRGWADRMLDRSLPTGPSGDAIRGDLRQERIRRQERDGKSAANRWYARQASSVWFWATRDRITGRGWRSGRTLPEPATGPAGFASDLGSGLRVLRRSPGYSAAVTLTLGVAMAATVSVFTIVRGVLLRELPYPEPDALVRMDAVRDGETGDGGVSYPTFLDWQEQVEGIAEMAAFHSADGVYIGDGVAEVWKGTAASPDFLSILGVHPLLGSFTGPQEGQIGELSIYLSHELWERRFGSDPAIVGSTIQFDQRSWLVRGVTPRGFHFPAADTQYWTPLQRSNFLDNRGAGFQRVIGRLASGVSLTSARQELTAVNQALNVEHESPGELVALRRIADVERAPVERVLWVFLGAVGFFLLVACANVAGLSLARTESRRQELSIRLSLGASRPRLTRQLLAESTVLALVGGALGLLGAVGGVRGLLALAPADLPRREAIQMDPMVVAFAFAVAVLAGVLFGLLPGLRAARIAGARPSGSRSATRASRRTHRSLAAAQVAMAVVLLSGSTLLLRSFAALNSVDTGFTNPEKLLMVEIGLSRSDYTTREQVGGFQRQLLQGLEDLPTVTTAGLSTHLPFSTSRLNASVARDGETYWRGQAPLMDLEVVNGDYRAALGLPLLRGRDPASHPSPETPVREVLMNEMGADIMWPDQDPIGKRFSFNLDQGQVPAEDTYYTVVGLVPNVMDGGLDADVRPRAYYDFDEIRKDYSFISGRFFYLIVRTTGDPYALVAPVRELVRSMDPATPLRTVSTLEQMVRTTTVPARFRTVTLTIFAALAVIVALLGIYGVMAYGVATSIRDIGVRMALGAHASSVRWEVLKQALVVVTVGGVVGVLLAGALGPVLGSMLFLVSERDPVTLIGVLGVAMAGSLAAAYLPALRASRVDPIRVLRQE